MILAALGRTTSRESRSGGMKGPFVVSEPGWFGIRQSACRRAEGGGGDGEEGRGQRESGTGGHGGTGTGLREIPAGRRPGTGCRAFNLKLMALLLELLDLLFFLIGGHIMKKVIV